LCPACFGRRGVTGSAKEVFTNEFPPTRVGPERGRDSRSRTRWKPFAQQRGVALQDIVGNLIHALAAQAGVKLPPAPI